MKHLQPLSLLLAVFFVLFGSSEAAAEVRDLSVVVDGLSCPFCTYGVEKQLVALDGIESVSIDLEAGTASITPSGETLPALASLRAAVENAGFTPGDISFTAIGTLSMEGERVRLALRGSRSQFVLLGTGNMPGLSELVERAALVAVSARVSRNSLSLSELSVESIHEVHTTLLHVDGLSCSDCVERLMKFFNEFEGVSRASLQSEEQLARLESIGELLDLEQLVALAAEAGFVATVVRADGEE